MPQKPLKKNQKKSNIQKKNIRKAAPHEEKANLKNDHLNAIKKGNLNMTKVINKNIESFILDKAKIGILNSEISYF